MMSDVLSTSLVFAGAASMDICISAWGSSGRSCHNEVPAGLILAGMAGYALGGPIIHVTHGHWDKAGYSLGLRVVPPAVAIGLGAAADSGGGGAALLGVGAVITAMVVDSAQLAYETVPVEGSNVSFTPVYDAKSRAGSVVLRGSF